MDHVAVGALLAAGFNSGVYQLMLVIHLVGAVVGFGGSALSSLMLRRAMQEGPEAAAAVRRAVDFASTWAADTAVYLAGAAGIAAVLLDDRWDFRQGWVTIAFVLYFAWVAIAHGALRPAGTKLAAALEAGPEQADEATRVGHVNRLRRRIEWWSAASNLTFVAAIVVMVTKPGL